MKNIIHDQKYVMLGIVANSSSLPANQNSKQQDQLGLKIQKSLPLSLTPCFSKVWQSLIPTSTVSTVSLAPANQLAFKFKNLFAPSSRLSPSLPTPKIFTPKRPVN